MDVTCRRCREPWDTHHLRFDMHWWWCHGCQRSVLPNGSGGYTLKNRPGFAEYRPCPHTDVELQIESADNGETPEQVRAWIEQGQPGWLRFVTSGLGCPSCHGTTPQPVAPLTATELDDIDVATEGQAFTDWL